MLCHTVPAALSVPLTGSPLVRTMTLLILPPSALTVIPRYGAVSVLPLAGMIDSRTTAAAPPALACPPRLAADFAPPEQAVTSKPNVAHDASVATAPPHSRDDQEVVSGTATTRNSDR